MNDLTLRCGCGTHLLTFEKEEYGRLDICAYKVYSEPEGGLIYRLRHCWQILKTGRPYGDQVTLEKSSVKQLQEFLEAQE